MNIAGAIIGRETTMQVAKIFSARRISIALINAITYMVRITLKIMSAMNATSYACGVNGFIPFQFTVKTQKHSTPHYSKITPVLGGFQLPKRYQYLSIMPMAGHLHESVGLLTLRSLRHCLCTV